MPKNERLRRLRVERHWRQQDVADQLGVALVTMQRWERGFQQPSAFYRVKLCALFGVSAQELGLLDAPAPSEQDENKTSNTLDQDISLANEILLWMVPYGRNPHFTGRDELLEHLMQRLSPQDTNGQGQATGLRRAALTQSYAVKGLGGVGKTQIAVEFAYRAHEQRLYTHTIWINAASEEAILTSFAALTELLPEVAPSGETEQSKIVAALIRWLEECTQPWLLIVDNADDLVIVEPYLPTRGNGRILLTTRANAVGALAPSLEVDCMSVMEGTHLLLRRAQREESASIDEIEEATNIAVALAQFPLALDQAGAYIEETGCSLHDYFQLYQQHSYTLLARRGKQVTHYSESVATTWSLSFQYIEQSNLAAAELLQLCAFLAPDRIPEELLLEGAAYWPPTLQQAVTDPLAFNQLLETLLAFSLIKRLTEHRLLSIHRLVQVVQRERLAPKAQRQWIERMTRVLNLVFPHDLQEVGSWSQCQRYLDQMQTCSQLIQEQHVILPEASEVFDRVGTYLRDCALYALAEPLYRQALSMREQLMGEEHPDTARSLNNLAILTYKQGKIAEAESLFLRTLHMQEQQLEANHLDLAATLTGLATLYDDQGKHAQTGVLYQRALYIQEQHLGTEHLDLITTLVGLAFFYFNRGMYERAETTYLRALHIQEQHLGPEHPNVAVTLAGLAYVYSEQGRYREEEQLYIQALHIQEHYFGAEHTLVSSTLNGLANLYRDMRKYEQAEALYQRVLDIQERQFGMHYAGLARVLAGYAVLLFKRGKYTQAEAMHRRMLNLLEPLFGPESFHLAYSFSGLGDVYREQGKVELAEEFYQRAMHIRKQQFGLEHPSVAFSLHGLALLYSQQGKDIQAKSLYQQALYIVEQQLGAEHVETANILCDFAGFQHGQGHIQEAAALYQRALTIQEHTFGADSPVAADTREQLREVQVELGWMQEME